MLKMAAILWFGTIWAFVAVMHAKVVIARDGGLSKFWRVHLLPLAAIGLALDCAFNAVFGSIMFREMPKEWLFTSRCKRWFRSDDENRRAIAERWARELNVFDPGHVD